LNFALYRCSEELDLHYGRDWQTGTHNSKQCNRKHETNPKRMILSTAEDSANVAVFDSNRWGDWEMTMGCVLWGVVRRRRAATTTGLVAVVSHEALVAFAVVFLLLAGKPSRGVCV
jgi:hypothetical protein